MSWVFPDHNEWWHRLNAALLRYEEAKRRVSESAVERLRFPVPDGDMAHRLALREETQALREYKNVLLEFYGLG